MDEEKRARISEMRECGIDPWGANEIPFGVRALQSGIEVPGIWISKPQSSDVSNYASSPTLTADPHDWNRYREYWADKAHRASSVSAVHGSQQPPELGQMDGEVAATTGALPVPEEEPSVQHPNEVAEPLQSTPEVYVPKGTPGPSTEPTPPEETVTESRRRVRRCPTPPPRVRRLGTKINGKSGNIAQEVEKLPADHDRARWARRRARARPEKSSEAIVERTRRRHRKLRKRPPSGGKDGRDSHGI